MHLIDWKGERLTAESAALDNLSRIKSAFIADISHEIKSPLGIMSGFAELSEIQLGEGVANEQTMENLDCYFTRT